MLIHQRMRNSLIFFVSGHKSMWEARTRPAFRATVLAQIAKEAKDNKDAFYDA